MITENFQGFVPDDEYYNIIKLTQLVSVDLLVNHNGKYLLGKRKNSPAKNMFFVPGGKVYNNETIHMGLYRIAKDELGVNKFDSIKPLGVYEHIYDDNYRDDKHGTHYIVIPFEITINEEIDLIQFKTQHRELKWLSPDEILLDSEVHIYNKYYFMKNPPNLVMYSSEK